MNSTQSTMIVQPKIRGFICTTAHPTGCFAHVKQWVDYVKQQPALKHAPQKVLIIGASTGFGLASRISAAFGGNAATIGVFFEKPAAGKRTASAGWYNTAAFEQLAHKQNLYAKSINGDAFSTAIKEQTIDLIRQDWQGGIDLVVYSIAAPRRIHPITGEVFNSVLKPIGQTYHNKTINVMKEELSEVTIEPAEQTDIDNTIAVMGGEDWKMWMEALQDAKLLAEGAKTVAFDYIGPELTYPIYRHGTIGHAKADLEKTATSINEVLNQHINGSAMISVNKALVTQASAAIPVVPLYISLLYNVMKEKGIHEGCIEQMWRLFQDHLYHPLPAARDSEDRIRIDDWEMRTDVQQAVASLWEQVNPNNLKSLADLQGYRQEFYHLFGFDIEGIDYEQAVNIDVQIPSIDNHA